MDQKYLVEKQTQNLLKAIELKNQGINDEILAKVVDYVIEVEVKELALKSVIEEKPTRRGLR